MKLKTRMTIGKPLQEVWGFFTTAENWEKWSGGVLNEAKPGWESGAQLIWKMGQPSVITEVIPFNKIIIKSRWDIKSWIFNDLKGAVLLEVEEEFIDTLPSSEVKWRNDWQVILMKFKECVECGPSSEKEEESVLSLSKDDKCLRSTDANSTEQKRPWWKIWA